MTHHDAGHYKAKHPADRTLNEKAAAAVREKAGDGKISCAEAARIAGRLKISMADVGETIDLLEIHLVKCQLGLFGYSPEKIIVNPAAKVAPDLEDAIRGALVKGRLPCGAAWEIADRTDRSRMDVSAACEKLKIKVKPCQLGAF
jgi:hypothetical protein